MPLYEMNRGYIKLKLCAIETVCYVPYMTNVRIFFHAFNSEIIKTRLCELQKTNFP